MVLPLIFTLVLLWHIGHSSHLLSNTTTTSHYPILYPFEIRELTICNPIPLFSKYSCLAFGTSLMKTILLLSSIHTVQESEVFGCIFSLSFIIVVFIKPHHGYVFFWERYASRIASICYVNLPLSYKTN